MILEKAGTNLYKCIYESKNNICESKKCFYQSKKCIYESIKCIYASKNTYMKQALKHVYKKSKLLTSSNK